MLIFVSVSVLSFLSIISSWAFIEALTGPKLISPNKLPNCNKYRIHHTKYLICIFMNT